jgi:hypothetical protein
MEVPQRYPPNVVEEKFSEVRIAPVPFRKGAALTPHVSLPDKTSGTQHYGSPVDQCHWSGAAIHSRK